MHLLGGFKVSDHRGDNVRIPYASQRVLALAALHRRTLPRRLAASRIWPHLPPGRALQSLRTALSRLNKAHRGLLLPTSDAIQLSNSVQVDVSHLEERALAVIRGTTTAPAAELPVAALTAPLLPEWDDDWVAVERLRLQELFLHAIEASALRLADEGQFALALHVAYAALSADPLRESAASTLISIYRLEGNRAQALRLFLEFRQRLRLALGVEPSEGLRALVATNAGSSTS